MKSRKAYETTAVKISYSSPPSLTETVSLPKFSGLRQVLITSRTFTNRNRDKVAGQRFHQRGPALQMVVPTNNNDHRKPKSNCINLLDIAIHKINLLI